MRPQPDGAACAPTGHGSEPVPPPLPVPILAPGLAGLPAVRHGFFTREGGVSTDPYASLNGGLGSGDARGAVARNRALIAERLGAAAIVSVAQVHGADAIAVSGPWPGARPEADAMVCASPGIALAILTADCAPVLLADPEALVIGAAHAGWKGARAGVIEATIAAMEAAGAEPARIRAAVGPTISEAAYEVGPEFRDRFLADDPSHARYFSAGAGDRAQFDLPGYVCARLAAAGVDASWTGHCTYAEPRRFFSYRRACHEGAPDYGRLVAAICLSEG